METLRFLMVSTCYPPYHLGGDAVHVQYLAEALAEPGKAIRRIRDVAEGALDSVLARVDPAGVDEGALGRVEIADADEGDGAALRVLCLPSDVRSHDDVGDRDDLWARMLGLEYVERGCSDLPRPEGSEQRLLVNHLSAGSVDD